MTDVAFVVGRRAGAGRLVRRLLLSSITAAALAGGLLLGGVGMIPVVLGLILLPWLIRDPIRLFVPTIVFWPIATLYFEVRLPAGIPDLRFERIMVAAILLVALTAGLVLKRPLPPMHPAVTTFALLQIGWYTFHVLSSGVEAIGLSILISSVLLPVAMYWFTLVFATSLPRLRLILWAIVAAGLLAALTGFYERAIGAEYSPFPVQTGTAAGTRYTDVPGGRAAGVFGNPAIYGAVLTICYFAARGLYADRHRLVARGAQFVLIYGVFVSFTRSAWLSAVVALAGGYLLAANVGRALRRSLALGVLVLVLGIGVAPAVLTQNPEVAERIFEQDNVTGRLDRMVYSWGLFLERPLLGHGPGVLDESIGIHFAADGEGFSVSHNTFLTLLVDGGLVVAIPTIALLVVWARAVHRVYRASGSRSVVRYVIGLPMAAMATYVVSGLALELKFFAFLLALVWMSGAMIERIEEFLDEDPMLGSARPKQVLG